MNRLKASFTSVVSLLLLVFALQFVLLLPSYCDEEARKREIRMGREGAVEVERQYKLVTDSAIVDRVNRIGQAIAKVANSTEVEASYGNSKIYQFDYKFKIIDDDSVNAFSLPGGIIYVHRGLLDYVQSDHELAGVLAHEVAHASHHHMVHLLREQSKLDSQIALMLLLGILGKVDSDDLGHLLIGAQLVRIAKTSGYGQKAEADADAAAVVYAEKAGFNPVGVLTVMERLAGDHARKPTVNMGILQTHPAPRDRCRAILCQIKELGLPINRRAVANSRKAIIEPAVVKGQSITQITLDGRVLFEPADIGDDLTSADRANAISTKLNQMLDSELMLREVSLSPDRKSVLVRGEPLIVVTEQDAALYEKPEAEIAEGAANVLRRVVFQEFIARDY